MFRSWFRSGLLALASLFAVTSTLPAQTPSSGKLSLAHAAPEECIFFVTWNGWTEPDPKTTNRTEKLFLEASVKEFLKQLGAEIDKVIEDAASRTGAAEATVVAKAAPLLIKTALTHPGAIYLSSFKAANNPEIEAALVLDAQDDGSKAVEAFKKLTDLIPRNAGPDGAIEEKIGDATFLRPREYRGDMPHIRIGYRGNQLLLTLGDATAKSIVDRLTKPGQPPAWLTQVSRDLVVERPSMLAYFDAQRLLAALQPIMTDPLAPKVIEALGLNKLKTFTGVSGLDKVGMHSISVITIDGTPTGLFDLIPDKPLTIGDFQKIPGNSVNATVTRFDLAYLYDRVLGGVAKVDPNARQQIEGTLAGIEPQLGFSVKGDLLEGLGDTWSFYSLPSEQQGPMAIPGFVITASIRKHEGVSKALNIVVAAARAALAGAGAQAPFSIQDFSAGSEKGYKIVFNNLPVPVQPTWVLTKDQLVIGLTPQLVSGHLSAAAKGSLADNEHLQAAFQWEPKPTNVSYSDPKPGLQSVYTLVNMFGPVLMQQLSQQGINFTLPKLPPIGDIEQHLLPTVTTMARTANGWKFESHGVSPTGVQAGPTAVAVGAVGAALLLPAVQQAREAARRSQSKNNLKQIGLAMHNYHDTYRTFPAAANADKNGKKLLSWRVHILPFVEQVQLYQQFHLDEPWDSEHNKKLIAQIPPVYVHPNHADLAKEGKTVYLVPTGEGTVFDGNEGTGIAKITDGTSNTILAVEAHREAAVIWTKPDELVVDFKNPLKNLKSALVGGFHVLLCDGAVRFISDNINADTMKALFTRGGGEVINLGAIEARPPAAAIAALPLAPARARPAAAVGDPKNNLKMIGLAFHNYADKHKRLPQRAATDKKGKALLSWRVHLLPYLDANDLYQQFKLDEPWDSDNNKPLISKMPAVFTSAGDEELAKQGKTRFVTPANAEGALGIKEGTQFREIRDGTSNTILAVEARSDSAVIWTKPEDVVIDFKKPLLFLKDARDGGFLTLMADGSVRLIPSSISIDNLKALVTRAGREPVGNF